MRFCRCLAAIAGARRDVHCWIWPTVPEREAPQTIWSLGEIALVFAGGDSSVRADDAIVSIEGGVRNWYSVA